MAAYPENTGGIISAIQACIVAAGGTLTTDYPKNTGGIISALIALQSAIGGGGGGGGGSVVVQLEAFHDLGIGDAVQVLSNGKVAKAHQSTGGREGATVAGLVREDVSIGGTANIIVAGPVDVTGWAQTPTDLTIGSAYFLNGAGILSTTPPSATDDYVTFIGEAVETKKIILNIDVPVLLK